MPRFNPIRGVPAAPPPVAPPPSRDELITQIAAACMRPCAPIVPSLNTPGAFCYLDPHEGTQYGTAFPTAEAAREAWDNRELDNAAAFAEQLAVMTEADLKSQAEYWLKPKVVPSSALKVPSAKRETRNSELAARTAITLKATTHTKKGHPIWIAQMTDRVERKEFTRLSAIAKAGGGYWSSFGPVDIHGFIFVEEAKAKAFQTLVNPPVAQSVPAPVVAQSVPAVSPLVIPVSMPPVAPAPEPVAVKAAVEVVEGSGTVRPGCESGSPVEPEPERDPVAEMTQGRTIWNSDGTDGPVLICPPPVQVAEVEAPVLTIPAWRQRLVRR